MPPVGRVGKPLLPLCKGAARNPETGSMLFFALSSLATLGLVNFVEQQFPSRQT